MTTFYTISAEWKDTSNEHPIFGMRWNRIILDEGNLLELDDQHESHLPKLLESVKLTALSQHTTSRTALPA